jgi:predicted HTH domain antitoxin
MNNQIAVSYPASLTSLLKLQTDEFKQKMKTLSLVKLYELGEISSSSAAKILGIPRVTFLDILGSYGVPCLDISHLETDFANA